MIIDKNTSFIGTYFDGKSGEKLRRTITQGWTPKNLKNHLQLIGVPDDVESVCEIGCGCGRLLKPICESGVGKCYGIDASQAMVDDAKEYTRGTNIKIKKCSGEGDIEFRDNFVDFSYSIITFQHIPNTEVVKKYISEMIRITKPGGEIMFQLLNEDLDKGYLWSYHDLDEIFDHLKKLKITTYDKLNTGNWILIKCSIQ